MKPLPFFDALKFIVDKEELPASWDSAAWASEEPDFRTKAFFSARVENARFLDRARSLIFDYIARVKDDVTLPDGTKTTALRVGSRADFVKLMREFMIEEGMAKWEDFKDVNQKDVTDLRSIQRLNLIFDTNVRQAFGFGQWKQGMTPAALRAFPAARLVREEEVTTPRERHEENLGEVRLKTDPWWTEYINGEDIGGFGVPWGPYGFNSGCNWRDVSYDDAVALALDPESAMPDAFRLTDGMKASVKTMDEDLKETLLDRLKKRKAERGRSAIERAADAGRNAATDARRQALQRGLDESGEDSEKASRYRDALEALDKGPRIEGDEIRM